MIRNSPVPRHLRRQPESAPTVGEQAEAVLNGIAYLPQSKHLLVTGKLWPKMYEIDLIPEAERGP